MTGVCKLVPKFIISTHVSYIVEYWSYDPSLVAAAIFAVLYCATCLITVFQYVTFRCWFWIFMVIASISGFDPI